MFRHEYFASIVLCLALMVFSPVAVIGAGGVRETKTVSEVIQQTLRIAKMAHTPIEQHQALHGFQIAFSGFLTRSTEEQAQVCPVMLKLTPRQLILLEIPILDKNNVYLDRCRSQLINKIEDAYEKDRQELRRKYGEIKHPDTGSQKLNSRTPNQDACAGKVGNYPPIEVDGTAGPSYGAYSTVKSNPHIAKPQGLAPKEIIFTMDDGPVPGRTEKALQAFEDNCVHVTMFLVGQSLATTGGQILLKRDLDSGHNVGNHTYSHPDNIASPNLTTEQRLAEVTKHFDLVSSLMDKFKQMSPENASLYTVSPFFRFPGGNESVDVLNYLHSHNMPSFTWQAGANDWLPNMTADGELQEALRELQQTNGGIFIVHDTHQATVDMIPYLLVQLNKLGFKIRHMVPKGQLPPNIPVADKPATPQPEDAPPVVTNFARQQVHVRSEALAKAGALSDDSLIKVSDGTVLETGDLQVVTMLGEDLQIGDTVFKRVRIEKTKPGFEAQVGQIVYIWAAAFPAT